MDSNNFSYPLCYTSDVVLVYQFHCHESRRRPSHGIADTDGICRIGAGSCVSNMVFQGRKGGFIPVVNMKGQLTIINIVVILLTLFALVFVAGLFYPILDAILIPALNAGDKTGMGVNLVYIIFPVFVIALLVMLWLWAKPIIGF